MDVLVARSVPAQGLECVGKAISLFFNKIDAGKRGREGR